MVFLWQVSPHQHIHMQRNGTSNTIMHPLFPLLKHFVEALIASLLGLTCCPSFVSLWGSTKIPELSNRHRPAATPPGCLFLKFSCNSSFGFGAADLIKKVCSAFLHFFLHLLTPCPH